MSENMVVKCQVKDKALLIEVLGDLGIAHQVGENLPMFGYNGSTRPQKADVVIDRRTIKAHYRGLPNDLGFRFANGEAEMIISEYDAKGPGRRMANLIMQEYSRRRVVAKARAQGYEVERIEQDDKGNMRVILAPIRRSARAQVHARRRS